MPRVHTPPHGAAARRGVASRTKQRAHKRAWHSPSQGYFIILGTETCSQNGDHSLRSRAERERAPTTKICAAIRWAVRQRFTLRRTGPRRVAAWRAEQSSARTRRRGTLRHSGISNFWVPNHVPKAAATVCAPERQHTNTNQACKQSRNQPTNQPFSQPANHDVQWRFAG